MSTPVPLTSGSKTDECATRNFLDLPAELRLLIFSHAWEDAFYRFSIAPLPPQSFVCAWPKFSLKAYDSIERLKRKGLPLWLLTCKQTLREGLSVFGEDFCFRADFVDQSPSSSNHPRYVNASKSMYINDLVVPRIHTLVIYRGHVCSHEGTPSTSSEDVSFKPEPDIKDHFDPVQAQLWFTRPGLQDSDPRKMYYVRIHDVARNMLRTLFRRRAPIKEIRILCEYRAWGECCGKNLKTWRRMINFGGEVSDSSTWELEGVVMRDRCWKVDVLNDIKNFGQQPAEEVRSVRDALHLRWRVAYED